jgi:hypothetical protein
MKKIMSLMIGMSLFLGAVSFAMADDSKDTTKKSSKKTGKKGKSTMDKKTS